MFHSNRTSLLLYCLSGSAGLLTLGLALGCTPPVVHFPAPPTETQVQARSSEQSRLLPLSREKLFPRVLEVLLDMGFQVRCASQELGQVNIQQTWKDASQAGLDISVEATLLFLPEGTDATRVRMVASGNWSGISSGKHSSATITAAAPPLPSDEYQRFLDQLASRLCPTAAKP